MIFQNLDFSLEVSNSFELKAFKFILSITNVSVSKNVLSFLFTIESFLTIKLFFSLIQSLLICINLVHQPCELLPNFINIFISSCNSFGNFLPFSKKNVPLIMFFFKFLSSFIKLNLACLSWSNLPFQFLLFSWNFKSKFLDL